MIRTEAVWMSVVPIDMRAGTDTLLARIVVVFGEARPHHAYLFANHRGTRMKVVVLVQHSFCKFVTCWFCEAGSAAVMRARSARRAKDGPASRRNPGRQYPQAIS